MVSPAGGPAAGPAARPRSLTAASVLVLAMAAVPALFAVITLVRVFSLTPASGVNAAVLIVTAALWSGGLVYCAVGLSRGHRWARTPSIVTAALLALGIGRFYLIAHQWLLGLPIVAVSVAAGVCLLLPSTGRALS